MPKRGTLLDWFLEHYGHDPDYLAEKLRLRVTRQIRLRMEDMEISQAELAKRLDVSQADISKKLSDENNLTLRSLALIADALEAEWESPRLVSKASTADAWHCQFQSQSQSMDIFSASCATTSRAVERDDFSEIDDESLTPEEQPDVSVPQFADAA